MLSSKQIQSAMSKKISNNRYFDEDDDDYDNYETKKEKKKQAPPRFTKNGLEKVDTDEIVVNLTKTHYDIIETVVEQLGWVPQYSKKSQAWDIMWTDNHIEAHDLFRLNDHQKISHFPAIEVLSKKNFLGRSLMRMGKEFPQEYKFFPPTWSVPSEMGELMRYDSQHAQDDKLIYIFKPESSSQGKGISLFSSIQQIQGKTGIVQTYLNNPYLIDGLKFDMRIYVLIYGCDPIRIYVYEEGLARFATQTYQKAKKKNLKDNYVHLTNYAINKNNKKFVFNTSDKQMHVGHKRSLTSIFNILKRKQINVDAIKQKIDALIVKTLLVGKPMLNHQYGLSQTDNLANDLCFHILGFDVMLDSNLEPFLLEVNHTPSFATDTPLDRSIKKSLIKQTFLLLNVNVETKKAKIEKKKQFDQKRAMRKVVKLTQEQKIQQKKLIEKEKNAHEQKTLKKYRKLYPLETNEYTELQEYAQKIFNEQYGFKYKDVNRQTKEVRQSYSPNKSPAKSRPASIQQTTNLESKLINQSKPRVSSSAAHGSSSTALPDPIQKLPDISPNRKNSQKDTRYPYRKIVKSYEFNPENMFPQKQQKISIQKIYIKQRLADIQMLQQSISLHDRERKQRDREKKQGAFVEPKMLSIPENSPKPMSNFQDIALDIKKNKNDRIRHRNFNDFTCLPNKQRSNNIIFNDKSPVLLVKRESQKKVVAYRNTKQSTTILNTDRNPQQLMLLKSLTSTKPGRFF